jgi:DNA invertase Pin-like site-specific DNA recombinase
MIIGYVRTSLTSEHAHNQVRELKAAGIDTKHIFKDAGVSGTVSPYERKGFQKLLDFVKEHPVTHLYVYELSRLGRDLTDTLTVIRDLDRRDICVQSLSPNESWLNCDASIRQLIISVMSWCAQRERENLIERTKVGMQRAKAQGTHCGRPFTPIDWKKVSRLHHQGMPFTEIAHTLSIPYSTLMRRHNQNAK